MQRALYGAHQVPPGLRTVELRRVQPSGGVGPPEVLVTAVASQVYKRFRAASTGPLRIVFRSTDLETAGQFCASATGTSPDFKGGSIACSNDTWLTAAKRDTLLQAVLPAAAATFARLLQVVPVSGPLVVPSAGVCGQQYTVPPADVATGVPDADLVVYVSAAPITGTTIAWAGFCAVDDNGRPVVARVNFSPAYLTSGSGKNFQKVLRTGIHELVHALGFSYSYMVSALFGTASAVGTSTRRGQSVTLFKGPTALAAGRSFFNCTSLDGIELEDEGGPGTAQSHWERRTHYDDLMAGIVGDTMAISGQTLGLLQDSGHYTANLSLAETAPYMLGFGCGAFAHKCNATEAGAGRYFCFEPNAKTCTWDRRGIGPCSVGATASPLPAWWQYFASPTTGGTAALFDYCPFVTAYTNRRCDDATSNTNDPVQAYYYGPGGRCFRTAPTLIQQPNAFTTTNPGPARCLEARCPGGRRVEFRIGASTWVACPPSGASAVLDVGAYGYTGTVECPPASDFCSEDIFVLEETTTAEMMSVTTAAPSTSAETATSSTTSATNAAPAETTSATSAAPAETTSATSAAPAETTSATSAAPVETTSATTTAPATAATTSLQTESSIAASSTKETTAAATETTSSPLTSTSASSVPVTTAAPSSVLIVVLAANRSLSSVLAAIEASYALPNGTVAARLATAEEQRTLQGATERPGVVLTFTGAAAVRAAGRILDGGPALAQVGLQAAQPLKAPAPAGPPQESFIDRHKVLLGVLGVIGVAMVLLAALVVVIRRRQWAAYRQWRRGNRAGDENKVVAAAVPLREVSPFDMS